MSESLLFSQYTRGLTALIGIILLCLGIDSLRWAWRGRNIHSWVRALAIVVAFNQALVALIVGGSLYALFSLTPAPTDDLLVLAWSYRIRVLIIFSEAVAVHFLMRKGVGERAKRAP